MLTRFDKKAFVIDLPLCRVYLEDEANYPWLFLVPRREGMGKIMDLDKSDQLQLIEELDWAQRILTIQFNPTQVNVAAIGNKNPQLHVHVIARFNTDPAWPQTVWDHPVRARYDAGKKQLVIESLQAAFKEKLPENSGSFVYIETTNIR